MNISDAIKDYQLCPGRHAMTRAGVCQRHTGCPLTCQGQPSAAIPANPGPVGDVSGYPDKGKTGKAAKTGRKQRKGPNQTELDYRMQFIKLTVAENVYGICRYEGLTLHLAAGYSYTPDWVVTRANGTVEIHEAKGPWQSRDAYIRWCQAAQEWPQWKFFWGKRAAKKDGGEWTTETRNTREELPWHTKQTPHDD